MSWQKFEDDCPGCQPALLDMKTRKPLPQDHPHMVKIMEVWGRTTQEQRQAFHRATCLNSRDPKDLAVIQLLGEQFKAAIEGT